MERRGSAVDGTDRPAQRTDAPPKQAGKVDPAPPATTSAAPAVVEGRRPDISRFGLPALAVAVALFASFGLEDFLWPDMRTSQTLIITGTMLGCVTLWWLHAPNRRSVLSLLVVVASVAVTLYLAFRLQQLLLPGTSRDDLVFPVGYGLLLIFWWLSKVSRRQTTVTFLAAVVLGAWLLNIGIGLRDRLQFQIPDILLIVVLAIFLLGLFLWWHERDKEGSHSELGAALLGGTVVAFAVLAFQWVLEQEREASAERRSLRIAIGMQSDLSGVDLSGRDLSGFYLKGKTLRNANLTDANLSGADLREANLSGADLSMTDLTDAKLSDADLPRADLTDANLTSADLAEANLARAILTRAHLNTSNLAKANLTRAHLTGADLSDTEVKGANLTGALADSTTVLPTQVNREKSRIYLLAPGADLRNADLSGADLTGQDLSKAKFGGANLTEANLTEANLSAADLSLARLDGTKLTDTRLQRANLTGTELADADLNGALADAATKWPKGARPRSLGVYVLAPGSDLRNAVLVGLDLSRVHLSGANLTGADLSSAVLSGTDLSQAHLSQADLTSARLDGADLTGAELSRANLYDALASPSTKWPQGFDPSGADAHVLGPGADLQDVVLNYADLSGFDLTGANLSRAQLSAAKLFGTNLSGANLSGADLSYAAGDPATRWPQGFDVGNSGVFILGPGVDLTDADLSYQDVSGANLAGAKLAGANLATTDLRRVNFSGADLSGTDLSEADLTGANLTDANLADVQADSTTIWPHGFNPRARGVALSE